MHLHYWLLPLFIVLAFFWIRDILSKGFYRNLFELEETLEGQLDFTNLSKNILTRIVKDTSATGGIIYWLDEAQQEFKLKTLNGIPAEKISIITRTLRQGEGFLEQIKSQPDGFIVNDLKAENGVRSRAGDNDLTAIYKALMMIPMVTGEKVTLGVLVLLKEKGSFRNKQLNLLTTFAPRMTVRLDNARLYQVTQETALENARLYVNISKLYQQAIIDELTGLYNRSFLMQRIKEEIKKTLRFKQPLSLIFADIDFFKSVNDKHGHQVGDELLSQFGALLRDSTREYDVACRFGGEEFVILLPHTHQVNATELAERLREKVAQKKFCSGLQITASFGVSSVPELAELPSQLGEANLNIYIENLVARADDALYQAKNNGRNQVVTHKNQQNP